MSIDDYKIPPNDTEAEESLLTSMIIYKSAVETVIDILYADDFYKISHQIIYQSIIDLYNDQIEIDITVLASKLIDKNKLESIGGSKKLHDMLDNIPQASNVKKIAEIIKNKSIKRKAIEQSYKIIQDCFDNTKSSEDVINDAQKAMMAIEYTKSGLDFSHISEIIPQCIDKLEELQKVNGGISGISSGIRAIDKMTSGFQNSDLIILAARPAMGKTTLAVNIIDNITKSGLPAAIFSLEMSKIQIVDRILSSRTGLNGRKFRNGCTREQLTKIVEKGSELSRQNLIINDCADMHYMDIRREARKYKQKFDIKLVVIDYLQLIKGDTEGGNRVQEITSISRALKIMAKELNIPVIALSQLNRMLENRGINEKRPKLADLRDSGSIEQDADIVCFLYRHIIYDPNFQNERESEIIFAKNRSGITGTVKIDFYKEITLFEDNKIF